MKLHTCKTTTGKIVVLSCKVIDTDAIEACQSTSHSFY
jgi:hypothetical protein